MTSAQPITSRDISSVANDFVDATQGVDLKTAFGSQGKAPSAAGSFHFEMAALNVAEPIIVNGGGPKAAKPAVQTTMLGHALNKGPAAPKMN